MGMETILGLFIFCITLFIYLHVMYHLKTSTDLEIYEIHNPLKDRLEELCNIRQPIVVIFNLEDNNDFNNLISLTNKNTIIEKYSSFNIRIRNTDDFTKNANATVDIPIKVQMADTLFSKDSSHFTENNFDFMEETTITKNICYYDELLRPYLMSNYSYDIMMGCNGAFTPFRHEICYRTYIIVTQGTAIVKVSLPQNSKYLHTITDYETLEFRSPINIWSPQEKYAEDFEKVKCLNVELSVGKMLFLPAYWWYSVKFDKDSSILCCRYKTYFNNVAILPHLAMHVLQLQNIKLIKADML